MPRRLTPRQLASIGSYAEQAGTPSSSSSPVARYLASYQPEPTYQTKPTSDVRTGVDKSVEKVSAMRGTRYLDHTDRMDEATHKAELDAVLAKQQLDNQKEYYRFKRRTGGGAAARRRAELRAARKELKNIQNKLSAGGSFTKNREAEMINHANRYYQIWEDYPELASMGAVHPDDVMVGPETGEERSGRAATAAQRGKERLAGIKEVGSGIRTTQINAAKMLAGPGASFLPEKERESLMRVAIPEGGGKRQGTVMKAAKTEKFLAENPPGTKVNLNGKPYIIIINSRTGKKDYQLL